MADDPWADFRVASPAAPAQGAAADPWAEFRSAPASAAPAAPAPDKPSVALDVAKAAPTGVAKGVIGLAGMPGDVAEMGGTLADRAALALGHFVMDHTGRGPQAGTPERADFDRAYLGTNGGPLPTSAGIRQGVERVTGPLYEPQTLAGQYAERVGEFAPSAVTGPGGLVAKVMGTAGPAIVSETAGQLTKGTAAEPYARLVGAVLGNAAPAAIAARADAPARAIIGGTRGTTPAELDAAAALQRTGAQVGVPLTGPEALQHVTGSATKLGDVQRAVDGSLEGGATLARFYADRPDRMRTATDAALDTVAPQSAQPSTLGPRAAAQAQGAIDDVRQGINRATAADYAAARPHNLDPADFDPIARDPAFQASLRRLRADEIVGSQYAHLPDSNTLVIDAVTKDMRDRGVALGNRANPGFSSQAAGMYGSGAAEARAIARDPARGGSQAYDDALTAQAQARRQNLEPLEQGPLGRVAAASDTAAAGEAVLPSRPLVGGQGEIADAVTRLATRDPDLAAALIRQRLADQADASMGRLVGGENQAAGARFAKDVAGTRQQEENLRAALGGLPNSPDAPQRLGDLIEVLRATGTRKPQGSPTDFNAQIRDTVGAPSLTAQAVAAAKSGGASLLTSAGDAMRRAQYGRNSGQLADLFVAPDSIDQMRALIARGAATPYSDAALRAGLQARAEER